MADALCEPVNRGLTSELDPIEPQQRASVQLSVYDVQGRLIKVVVERDQPAGWHEVTFKAGVLPSGVYLYQLEAGPYRAIRQMMLLK